MITAMRRCLSVLVTLAVTGVRATKPECGQQELSRCAKPLQVLSDTSELNFVSKKEELDQLCPDLFKGLTCIKQYTQNCMTAEQRGLFGRLYRGTDTAVRDLCTEGDYQQRFLQHAPCLRGLKSQYERCATAYQSAVNALSSNATNSRQSDKLKVLCCSFQAYMGCSERAVLAKCGEESADFTKEFLHRMGDTLMKMHCSDYPEGSPLCVEYLEYSSSSSLTPSLLALLLPILSIFLLHLQFSPFSVSIFSGLRQEH